MIILSRFIVSCLRERGRDSSRYRVGRRQATTRKDRPDERDRDHPADPDAVQSLPDDQPEHVRALREMDPDLASALSTQPVPGQQMAQQMGLQQQANAMQQPNTQTASAANEPPPPGEGQNVNPAPMPA